MKLQIFAFALFMPLATASALSLSLSQEQQVGSSAVPAASASTHHPLFTIKYVLVREQPEAKDALRIEQDDDRAAIRALPLSSGQWPVVQLNGGLWNPNMYVCSGWGCKDVY